jgi:SAM-dependent methyltransferase
MSGEFNYHDYIGDNTFLGQYNAYQTKYAGQMRESDKVLIELVREIVGKHDSGEERTKLIDVGCSTGNLLLHLKRQLPALALTGVDLAESSLDLCRSNPDLEGVLFEKVDLLTLGKEASFDIITINAVLYMMEDQQFETALGSLAKALRPGGVIIVFDFFHPFPHDLHIIEMSRSHPAGLRLRFRTMGLVEPLLHKAGFKNVVFRPFTLPMELPPSGGSDDLITYTVATREGAYLPFRGTLFQPWCHLTAVRA